MRSRARTQMNTATTQAPSFTPVWAGLLQRSCACGGLPGMSGERAERHKKHPSLQRRAINQTGPNEAPSIVYEALRSPGQPLDPATSAIMETRFGHDFSKVRVHTDALAAGSAEAVNALAYTVGQDVVFGAGQYAPHTSAGQRLLIHELAHTVQQGGRPISGPIQLEVNSPGDRFEQEADRTADALMRIPVESPQAISGKASYCSLSVRAPGLQRTARFTDGTVTEDLNLAERLVTGQAFAGNTDFVLNGTPITSGTSFQDALGALKKPGISSAAKGNRAVECKFNSEPDNEVSYKMNVLSSSAWTITTTSARIAALFPRLVPCRAGGTANVRFTINGKPSNQDVRNMVRTHEDKHAADYKTIFNDVLAPWDKRVAEAYNKGQTMLGTNADDCEKKLYLARVGQKQTPKDIMAEIINSINSKARAFHNTAAGRNVNVSNVQSDPNCNTITAEAT